MTAIGPKECPNAVDGGEGHRRIWEDAVPIAEGLICRDGDGASFVPCADQFEEDAGFGLVLGDVGQVIEDDQLVVVEAGDGRLECQFSACDLQLLNEIADAEVGVRVKSTRQPFSIRPRPMAAARWVDPPPGGPNRIRLAPASSHLSPATREMTRALESAEGQKAIPRGAVE